MIRLPGIILDLRSLPHRGKGLWNFLFFEYFRSVLKRCLFVLANSRKRFGSADSGTYVHYVSIYSTVHNRLIRTFTEGWLVCKKK